MTSPLAAQLSSILSGFGVAPVSDYDTVTAAVATELDRAQLVASIESLRHGVLTLSASPRDAVLLRYDVDALTARINEALPGAVTRINVVVRRTGRC